MRYVMYTHLLTYIRPPCLYINAYIDTYILYNIRYYIRVIKYFETAHLLLNLRSPRDCPSSVVPSSVFRARLIAIREASPPFGEEHCGLEQDISFPGNTHLLILRKCYAVHINASSL